MKLFDLWNRLKQRTDAQEHRVYFHEREIWMGKWGENIGYEQNGKGEEFLRPILIVKKFNNALFWGVALTSKPKTGKFYFEFSFQPDIKSYAILSQLRLFDAKRLQFLKGHIAEKDFSTLKKNLTQFLK